MDKIRLLMKKLQEANQMGDEVNPQNKQAYIVLKEGMGKSANADSDRL